MRIVKILFVICFFTLGLGYAQEIDKKPMDVESLGFVDLIQLLNSDVDDLQKEIYSHAFLKLAKKKKDTFYIIGGYELVSNYSEEKNIAFKYLDSVIYLSKKNPGSFYPAKAYLDKGVMYHGELDLKKSFENNLQAFKYSTEYPNIKFQHLSKLGIASVKGRLGDFKSVRSIQMENVDYFRSNLEISNNKDHFLNALFSLSVSQMYLGEYKKAYENSSKGIAFAEKYGKIDKVNLFRLGSGAVLFFQDEFERSIDSIQKSLPNLIEKQDNQNLMIAYYYLALNYEEQRTDKTSILYLRKIDSLSEIDNYIDIKAQNAFYHLINYYEKKGDTKHQLQYLKKTITLDSTLDILRNEIGLTINKEFDIPNLIADKNELIVQLDKNNNKYKIYFLIALLLICVGSVFFILRQRKLKKKFNALLNRQLEKKSIDTIPVNANLEEADTIGVPKEIIAELLIKLDSFEEELGFLDTTITLSNMAEKMGTNTNYLSKTINHYKRKGLKAYLNDLRIDYAIDELKENLSYRKYTISAIAISMGFKSAETFSKLFKAKTGIYPSFYIKELNKTKS